LYLCGCIGLVKELERYAVGRAIKRDRASVEMARDLTDELLAELMNFDFRKCLSPSDLFLEHYIIYF